MRQLRVASLGLPDALIPKTAAKKDVPGQDIRKSFYKTSDGVEGLLGAARKLKDQSLVGKVKNLESSLTALRKALDAGYNWD